MVLRLYRDGGCTAFLSKVTRLILSEANTLEVRIDNAAGHEWKVFQYKIDYNSFVLAKE